MDHIEQLQNTESTPLEITLPQHEADPEQPDPVIDEQSGLLLSDLSYYISKEEIGLGYLYSKIYKKKFCYDSDNKVWLKFNGVTWTKAPKNEHIEAADKMISFLREVVTLHAPDTDLFYTVNSLTSKFNTFAKLKAICEAATIGEHGLLVNSEDFDQNRQYICAPNGMIDLETGELLPGDPELFMTMTTGVEYDPDAPDPQQFIAFLQDVFKYPYLPTQMNNLSWEEFEKVCQKESEELINFTQKLFGYSLLGTCAEQIFVMFYGNGRNGKGKLVGAIENVFGDHAIEVNPNIFIRTGSKRSSSAPASDKVRLKGSRLIRSSETDSFNQLNEAFIKLLTGGDSITARMTHAKSEVSFKPQCTPILLTNHLPLTTNPTIALWSRMRIVHFTRFYEKTDSNFYDPNNPYHGPRDTELENKLASESVSILKWVIDGALKYKEEGLNSPDSVQKATEAYRNLGDELGQFIEHYCIQESNARVKRSSFTVAYNAWRKENHEPKKVTSSELRERLSRKNFGEVKSSGIFYFTGLTLNQHGMELIQ